MTLLRDVIIIPEAVHAGDYVLKLTEGVENADATIEDYVVTPAIARAFGDALGLVEAAVTTGRSQAAFVHGSFGAGKSHFLAFLHTLLGGDPRARAKEGLATAVDAHDKVLQGRKFLRLSYHLIGATSLEAALLGGYVEQIARLHPDADLPAVHRTDQLLADAEGMRVRLGDDAFFAALTGAAGGSALAAAFSTSWTPASYAQAASALPEDARRTRLVSALVRTFYSSFVGGAAYVDLDTGLRQVSEHAKSLGYDAVVLFLDELVLWLAGHLADPSFVSNEGAKVAKLVESGDARRPIPLVAFISRQRDLRDFLGESAPGAQQAAIGEVFRWWEQRFDTITLGDENLPFIAQRRLLRPLPGGEAVLDAAFQRLDRRPEVWNTLLDGVNTSDKHLGADQAAFRLTYPFSPALVSTIRAVSGLMQRERTALKVMQQLLVDQRDELTVDDVVPVGDVFDAVVEDQVALDPEMERHFATARRLYRDKLRPLILAEHGLTDAEAEDEGYRSAFRADDRIVKTVLLAALAPAVPALQALDARRLAALNHGTIASPIAGAEATTVLAKLQGWRTSVPELQLSGDSRNPLVSAQLADVDYQSVLVKAGNNDTVGNRRRLLKELAWEALGVPYDATLTGLQQHSQIWRGSKRKVDIVFGNVRDAGELPDDLLRHDSETWRLVIDFPFDEEGAERADDFARVEALGAAGATARTVAWLPRYLSNDRLTDLGRLVILEWLFAGSGDRFDSHSDHLSVTNRIQARTILTSMRSSTRERLLGVLQQAYGAAPAIAGDVDAGTGELEVLRSLEPSFTPSEPVGANLNAALRNLVDQMMRSSYPAHPDLTSGDVEVRPADLRILLDYISRARETPNGRVEAAAASDRKLLVRLAKPLGLGELHEKYFVFDANSAFPWRNRFVKAMANEGLEASPIPVVRALAWTDADEKRGLDRAVAATIVLAWALVTDRSWWRAGGRLEGAPNAEAVSPLMELREQQLPTTQAWEAARLRAAVLFGGDHSQHLSTANVAKLAKTIRVALAPLQSPVDQLPRSLSRHAALLGLDSSAQRSRLVTAQAAHRLVGDLQSAADDLALVTLLGEATLSAEDRIVARSMSTASAVVSSLGSTRWEVLEALTSRTDDAASVVLADLIAVGRADEFASRLVEGLQTVEKRAIALVIAPPPPRPDPVKPDPEPPIVNPDPARSGQAQVSTVDIGTTIIEIEAFASKHDGKQIRVTWQVVE